METVLLALLPMMMSRRTGKSLTGGTLMVYTQPGPKHQKDQEDGNTLQEDVKRVRNTKFLGLHLLEELTNRETTTAAFKKAQQCLCFLRRLKTVELPIPAMTLFYRGTIVSILTYCI